MTIGQWIKEYCTENGITLPSGMGDYNTMINWLILQKQQTPNDSEVVSDDN